MPGTSEEPRRQRWRQDEADHATMVQWAAGHRGLLYGGILGGLGCYFAGHIWPSFGRQHLQVKVFLTTSVAMAWFTFSADKALLKHEEQERDFEARMRTLARTELGRKGIIPTEAAIADYKNSLRQEYYQRTGQAPIESAAPGTS